MRRQRCPDSRDRRLGPSSPAGAENRLVALQLADRLAEFSLVSFAATLATEEDKGSCPGNQGWVAALPRWAGRSRRLGSGD